jgi:16S rRNA (adenine1518-N6/adenine1519-N6)-dimethyltransferase
LEYGTHSDAAKTIRKLSLPDRIAPKVYDDDGQAEVNGPRLAVRNWASVIVRRKWVNVTKAGLVKTRQKPKLGQHFLADLSVAQRIVDAVPRSGAVLEIGPGKGVLTSLLASRVRRVIAVELDRVLAAQLRLQFALVPNVEIIEGNILGIDLATLFGPKPGLSRPGLETISEPVQVVGNLPYYITSDILLRLFRYREYFSSFVVMVQREVAERMAARPGGSEYGLLSATVQLYSQVDTLFSVPPGAFNPPPKVHSAVVRLRLSDRMPSLNVPGEEFEDFLRLCFGLKRKTLWNNLKSQYPAPQLHKAMTAARVKESARAETLSLEQMSALFRALDGLPERIAVRA